MDETFNFSEVIGYINEEKDAEEILDKIHFLTGEYEKCSYQSKLTCVVIWLNREDILNGILKRGWSVTGRKPGPLHTACAMGEIKLVQLLLTHMDKDDVNYNAFAYDGENLEDLQSGAYESPLYFAVAHDDPDLLKILLPYFQVDQSAIVKPLHYCCVQGAVKCAKYLLDSGHSVFDTTISFSSRRLLSGQRPLEIAMQTSLPLTELLLEYEASSQVHQDALTSPDCDMLIHNVIESNAQYSVVKWKSGLMPSVVKLLIDRGVSVNGYYYHRTLIEIFFFNIKNFYEAVNAKDSFSRFNTFFDELLICAAMVKQAGLDATRQQLFNTFSSNFCVGPSDEFYYDEEPNPKYMSEALSRGVDLLLALWPNDTRLNADETFDFLTKMLIASSHLLRHLTKILTRDIEEEFEEEFEGEIEGTMDGQIEGQIEGQNVGEIEGQTEGQIEGQNEEQVDKSEESYESFYQTLHSVLVRIFLDFPDIDRDGPLIKLSTLQTFLARDSNTRYMSTDVLLLLLNLTSIPDIHLLKVPEECKLQRITLKNITRLVIIRHLCGPKTEKISQLPLPKKMKTYLLF